MVPPPVGLANIGLVSFRSPGEPQSSSSPVISRRWHAAGVTIGGLSAAGRLARIGGLLGGLPGPCGNGEILAWADLGDTRTLPGLLFGWIGGAGLFDSWPPGVGIDAPQDAADLMTRLWEIDRPAAVDTLAGLASVSMAYRMRGRYPESEARQVFGTLASLLGHRARWWASTGPMGSNPVTRHTFDAVVAGAGAGVIATVLAFDED